MSSFLSSNGNLKQVNWDFLKFETEKAISERVSLSTIAVPFQRPLNQIILRIVRALGLGSSKLFHNSGFEDLLSCSWEEFGTLYLDQLRRNQEVKELNLRKSSLLPYNKTIKSGFIRSFNQLPASLHTVREREFLISQHFEKSSKILLIGDDDGLSVHLNQLGYNDLTVVDIDDSIIAWIKSMTNANQVNCAVLDITSAVPDHLIKPYDLIVFDPICSYNGCKIFFEAALKFSVKSNVMFFVCTNLRSQMRAGVESLRELLHKNHLEVVRVIPNLNIYPLQRSVRLFVKGAFLILSPLAFQTWTWNKHYTHGYALDAFISDGYFIKRNP